MWRITALLAATAIGLGAGLVPSIPAEAAPPTSNPVGCGYAGAGTGTYASTLCWLDMSDYDRAEASSTAGQQMSVSLPGGYDLSFTLRVSGNAVGASAFPTWGSDGSSSGAYLGRNGNYTGVPGKPALYQESNDGGVTTAEVTDIVMRDAAGHTVTGYSLVGADAETTDGGEYLKWESNVPLTSINELGNACGGKLSDAGTTSVTCNGTSTGDKTGTAMLAAKNPSTFTQVMRGSGKEGFAFGVLTSKVELDKTVVDGYPGDDFAISITDSSDNTVATADTGGSDSASTGEIVVLAPAGGAEYTYAETAESGELGNYTATWACTRNGEPDSGIAADSGASATTIVNVGDFVHCTITNAGKNRALTLTKHAGTPKDVNADGITDAGDSIRYTFTVLNSGQVAMHGIRVSDAKAGVVTCDATTLAPGASTTCTADAPYVITPADQTAGAVDNTATASGLAPSSSQRVDSNPSSTHTPVATPNPAISLKKSAALESGAVTVLHAGDVIHYSFVATNTGNVPLSDVTVDEGSFDGDGTAPAVECPDASVLRPGAQLVCSASYTVTQKDVDRGSISNAATAEGTPPGTDTPETSTPSKVTVPATADPSLALTKTADATAPATAGQKVHYTFTVTNNGNVTISDVHVAEGAFTGSGTLSDVTCPSDTTIVPGERLTCDADYTVTQADVDADTAIENDATASGTSPTGATVTTDKAQATVAVVPTAASLTLVKTADTAGPVAAGQRLGYTFTATNTGNVTLHDVAVDDGTFTGHGALGALTCGADTTLAPGDTLTCHADYTVTQADIDAGTSIANSAVADGTAPAGTPVVSNRSSTSTPTTAAAPALTIRKSVQSSGADGDHAIATGDAIAYSFLVTNTGNVTLTDVGVDETDFTGSGTLGAVDCPDAAAALAPGAQVVCTADYVITQDDVDAGTVVNTAGAHGTPPGATTPIPSGTSTVVIPADAEPGLALTKTSDAAAPVENGATVSYTFAVTNTGNVTVHGIRIDEGHFTGHGDLSAVQCPADAALAPGGSLECRATYTVVAGDSGDAVSNTATAEGIAPRGTDVTSDPSSTDFTVATVERPTDPSGNGGSTDPSGNGVTDPAGPADPSGPPAVPTGDASGALAITGSDVWVPASLGGLLLLAGLGALIAGRRRRRRS